MEEQVKKLWKLFPAVFITGPRRAGKTTMVKKIGEEFGANYVSLDDPDARTLFNKDVKQFSREYLDDVNIIDEIQYGEDPGRKLKYLIDLEGKRFLVTGSSARAVSRGVISFLVGRASWVVLYPFSIHEIVRARYEKEPPSAEMERLTKEYALYGGFPEVVLGKNKKEILGSLVRALIGKEVPNVEGVDATDVWTVTEAIALSQGGPVNIKKLSDVAGETYYTTKKIINALEEAFVVKRVKPFFGQKRLKELKKSPKVYFIDPGILTAIAGKAMVDGTLLETTVLAEILKSGSEPYYWRTRDGAEVDFVVREVREGKVILAAIEVKMSWKEKRVPRGLKSFIETYHPWLALIVDPFSSEWEAKYQDTIIKKIPLWRLGEELQDFKRSAPVSVNFWG